MAGKINVILGMGQPPREVEVQLGDTVQKALERAGLQIPNAKDVRVNTKPASLQYQVMPGDSVSFLPKIEGGR